MPAAPPVLPAAAELPDLTPGLILLRDGGEKEAESFFRSLLVHHPGEPNLLAGLSRARTLQGDFDTGLDLADQAAGAAVAAAQLALGEALFRAGRLDAAGVAFRRALALDPGTAAAHHGLSRVLLTVPDYAAAAVALRRAHDLEPDDPRVVRRLAGLVASRQESVALFRRCLELPAAEGEEVRDNVRAWLGVLRAAGERPLFHLEAGVEASPPAASVPLSRLQGRPWVEVTLGEKTRRSFLLDSGAGGLTVPSSDVARLGLETVSSFTVRGISGTTQTHPFVLLPSLSIGGFTFTDVPAVVTPARGGARGILGLSILAPLDPGLDGLRSLSLSRPGGSHEDAHAANGDPGCPRPPWWRFRNIGGLIRVDVMLAGRPLHMVVDTGSARTVLARAALRRLGIAEAPAAGGSALRGITGAAANLGRVRRPALLEVFGVSHQARGMDVLELAAISDSKGSEIDGVLGVDVLGDLELKVDYGAGRIMVRPRRPRAESPQQKKKAHLSVRLSPSPPLLRGRFATPLHQGSAARRYDRCPFKSVSSSTPRYDR